MVQDSKSRKLDQYIVRFPDGMRDRIKKVAEANGRSMNAEIIATLEEHYPAAPSNEEVIAKLREAIRSAQSHPKEANEPLLWDSALQVLDILEKREKKRSDKRGTTD